ncbi:zinc ribbon domain-containing protein [Oscillospiraceae bacterium WX1]
MFCVNCGQKLDDDTLFCPGCGQKQDKGQTSSAPTGQNPPAPSPVTTPQPVQLPHQTYIPATPAHKPRKKHGCLIALIIVIVLLAAAVAAVYFLIPGLLRPNDLGIKSTRAAYESAMVKIGVTKDAAPTSGSANDYKIIYGAPHDVSTALSSEELTSFFNENRPSYYAVKNVQVRVNPDGTIEASAKLDTSYVFNNMLFGQYTRQDAQKALPMVGLIPNDVNIYFKVNGSVVNNTVRGLDIADVKVMGIDIPQDLISQAEPFVTQVLNTYIASENARAGTSIDLLQADNGKLDLKGSLPDSVSRVPAQ